MAVVVPNEIIDDLSILIQTNQQIFTVRRPPYIAESVSVYVNGLLQDPTFVTETDPEIGTINLEENFFDLLDETSESLHVAYLSNEQIFVDPEDPIHISQLALGDVVRIAMKPGRHLEPVVSPRTKQLRLMPRNQKRAARNYSRTVFLGYITANDRGNGVLSLQVEMRGQRRSHAAATVPYRMIQHIQRYLTPGRDKVADLDSYPVGGGPDARRRPGLLAKGYVDRPGFMKLIRVYF